MSVENKQVRGDASVSRNVNAGGNARVQGNMHVGHNLRVDGAIEAQNIKAANKGLFLDEAQLKARYPQPEEGWFAGVGSSSPFVVYIARKDAVGRVDWYATNGTFSVDVDMDSYNQRIDELENQVAELTEIILSGGGGNVVNVRVSVEGHGSVTGSGLYQIGNPVTLTATAENGYHFVEWQDAEGNTITGAGATYTFEATESVTLKAVFAVSYFTVTVGTDQTTLGDVSKSPSDATDGYIYNEEVTLTATPKQAVATAYFVRWEDGQGVVKSTSASYTFNVTENVTLKAVFAEVAVIDRGIDSGSTGNGTITATVTRGGTTVAETDVRIGDHIVLTLTGTSKRPSELIDGNNNTLTCTPSQDGKTWTYEFDYNGSQSLSFTAKFECDAIIVTYEVQVLSSDTNQGSVHIEYPVGTPVVGNKVNLEESEQIKLVATGAANTDYVFDKWLKNGTEEVTITDGLLTVSPSTAGLYVATFRHSGEPDYYYGAVTPDSTSGNAYDKSDVVSELTAGWIGSSSTITTPNIEVGAGEKFIMLYNPLKVKPTSGSLVSGGLTTRYVENDFTDDATFLIPENGKTVNEVTYNVVETWDAMEASDVVMQVTFTKQQTN